MERRLRKPALDQRIAALADVINAARSPDSQAWVESMSPYKRDPGRALPATSGRRIYQSAWRRAMRKIKIMIILRSLGIERRESRQSTDKLMAPQDDKTVTLPIGAEKRTFILKSPDRSKSRDQMMAETFTQSGHSTEQNKVLPSTSTAVSPGIGSIEPKKKNSLSSNITDEFGMKAIAIQTDKLRPPSPPPVKSKKLKRKARSQQVDMPDSHLDLETLRLKQEETEFTESVEQRKMETPGKTDKLGDRKNKRRLQDQKLQADSQTVKVLIKPSKRRQRQRSITPTHERKIRNDRPEKDGTRAQELGHDKAEDKTRQKNESGSQILLYQGRLRKSDYDPNLDDRQEKYLASKAAAKERRSKNREAVRGAAEAEERKIQQEKEHKEKKKKSAEVKPPEITAEERRGIEDKKDGLLVAAGISGADDVDGLKPPGDPELVPLEPLCAPDQETPEDLDPELVKRVEEQIFDKIKFYKDVQSKVREKQWFMRKKMRLRAEARDYIARFEGVSSGGGGPGFGDRLKVSLTKLARELSNSIALLVPWEGKIKNIESFFGSVVASYFTFLRWLFWINFIMALICGVVIIMPEVMFGPSMGSVPYKSVPDETSREASYLNTLWNFNGYAQVSPIFYGYYSSIKRYDSGFRMPFAYMLGNLMMFAYSFYTILRQMAANSKDEKATDKDDNFTFSWRAFTSWDYMIGNEETAKNKYKSLIIAIRESITESKESAKKISGKTKFLRVFANFLVLAVLGSSTYGIFFTVQRSNEFQERIKEYGPDSVSWIESNEISLVLSLVTAFFPMLFDLIAAMEDYHPRVALQWSLRRIMVLYLLNLYTLFIALYQKINAIEDGAIVANTTFYANLNYSAIIPCPDATTSLPIENTTTVDVSNSSTTISSKVVINETTSLPCGIPEYIPEATCWETMVGQELIKLTVFDFVTTVALIYVTEFFRAVIIRVMNACWCWDMEKFFPAYAEFSLAENLLHLIYNQGMIWMGTLFCPGLPALNLFKLLCLFYVRAWAVMVCNVPHERIFKAGSDNFYLMLLMFMLYVVMIPIAFAMVNIRPSIHCGPFTEVEYMYLVVTEWMKDVLNDTLFSLVKYMASPGALIPIFILLFLIIYSLSSSNDALQGTVLDLKKQLQYERKEGKKKLFNMNKETAAPPEPTQTEKPIPSLAAAMTAARFIGKMKMGVNRNTEQAQETKQET